MSVATVRTALSDAVDAIAGLRAVPYMPDKIQPPVCIVLPGEFDPRMVFAGAKSVREFVVTLFTSRTAEVAAQKLIDSFCETTGSLSIIGAIQGWTALNNGTTADYAVVTNVSGLRVQTVGAVDHMAVEFTIEVCF